MVKWTITAKLDLKSIHDYIVRDSKYYAKKVSQDIIEKTEILNNFPEIGRIVPEIDDNNIRELLIYSYRLVYEVLPSSDILILTLIHGRRNFTGNLNVIK